MTGNLFYILERMLEETGKFRIQYLDENGYYSAFLLEDIELKREGGNILIKGINGTQKYSELIFVDDFAVIEARGKDKEFIFDFNNDFIETYVHELRFYVDSNSLDYSIRVA